MWYIVLIKRIISVWMNQLYHLLSQIIMSLPKILHLLDIHVHVYTCIYCIIYTVIYICRYIVVNYQNCFFFWDNGSVQYSIDNFVFYQYFPSQYQANDPTFCICIGFYSDHAEAIMLYLFLQTMAGGPEIEKKGETSCRHESQQRQKNTVSQGHLLSKISNFHPLGWIFKKKFVFHVNFTYINIILYAKEKI